ncbi:hypothetical protein [Chryseobacterium sp. ISL-6]|uniref:hypothetical protein n=1 Tax=Chryseobacterium sp. ISL-6 TaxID=2819143 RepID=UPI001BE53755|nr:hypothetical protein [Chryseobacterium sp. ISL-6]MBT2623727.1 hypothetical protein [Chryseobacterium sp. ISL-6]
MRKLVLLIGIMTFCVNLSIAQTITTAKKETATAVKLKKDGTPDKRYTSKVSAATSDKVTAVPSTRLKKDGTPDKRYAPQVSTTSNTSSVKLKKDGTPDKRYSSAKEKTVATSEPIQTVNRPNVSNVNSTKDYKPTIDRSLKGPNGEEILTGPRGGKYYINKNGNKTYIKRQ